MSKIIYKKGNLLDQTENLDLIGHGCNCFLSMGAGIAKEVKERFSEAHLADLNTKYGDRSKLGDYTLAEYDGFKILNLYTQYKYTRHEVDADYSAIASVFAKINEEYEGKSLGIPVIGAGLAGGDWTEISKIIEAETPDLNVFVYILPRNKNWHYLLS
jgi:O-acetyl-ADP-ribose deacetylase (regulator of RNase III)|tara:strand:- start:3833 stop:4306 length:474 start_codon:yes stop_codon:yes gene_type:complete